MTAGLSALALAALVGAWPLAGQEAPDEAAAQRLMLQAQRYEQQGNLDAALDEYAVLVSEFPQSPQAPAALLQSARLRSLRGERSRAIETAQGLIDAYPRDPAAAAAWVLQGQVRVETATSLADFEEAQGLFRRVALLFGRAEYPTLAARTEALVRQGEVGILLGTEIEAAAAYLEAIEDEPASAWTAPARLGLATVLLWQGEWVAAAEILQRVVDAGAGAESGTAALAAQRARHRLTLIHRLYLRPQASQPSWQRASSFTIAAVSFKRLMAVAASDDGRVIVVDDATPVTVLASPEGTVEARGSYRNPGRPFFDAGGNAYVAVQDGIQLLGGGKVTFTLGGDKPKPLKKVSAGGRGAFEEWFVVDREAPGIPLFGREAEYRTSLLASELPGVEDLARDARGRLYVLDARERRIQILLPDGQPKGRISGGSWRRPLAVDVDLLGNLYVLDRQSRAVSVLRPDGSRLTTLGPRLPGGIELRSPEDLAVDGAGRVFLADSKSSSLVVVE